MSDECSRIIEAEATYLSAILCFFEESIASFFRVRSSVLSFVQSAPKKLFDIFLLDKLLQVESSKG